MGRTLMRRPRRALAAAAIFGMVGGSLAAMGTAQAAVMLSGSTIDPAGNNVAGKVSVYNTSGALLKEYVASHGTFDIPLDNGTYKLAFVPTTGEHSSEYYRDKADLATADVVTVSGHPQTLPAWTIERIPSVTGVVRTSDGRPVRNADVYAYDASSGLFVDSADTDTDGFFRVASTSAALKLEFRGYDPATGDSLATEWYNDKPSKATADAVAPTAAGADLGVVTLAPGGSISGRVTTEAGAPVYRALACAGSFQCDHTNANGVYTIEGVQASSYVVKFSDPIGEYVTEYWNNASTPGTAASVTVAPGQAVTGIDAALAAEAVAAPNGVDVSGTVRDELGALGIGYAVLAFDTPADPDDRKIVAETITNRAGQYHFAGLDRVAGETEFKIVVQGESPREEGEFSRRSIWSGDRFGYDTALAVTAAPKVIDFVQPVAGGVAGAITSEVGGVPEDPWVLFYNSDQDSSGYSAVEANGAYDERTLWAGTYTVQFGADYHVSEWWKDTDGENAMTITVKPGQMTTGISAVLTKNVKATERPEITGNAWVGKTLRIDRGHWNTEATSKFTYEWLSGTTVIGTGTSLELAKAHLGKKLVVRVTNDAGFALGQAVTAATPEIGYQPKLKTRAKVKSVAMTLKAKPLKAKKTDATVVVYKVNGRNAEGELKLKKLGKGQIVDGEGRATLKKALSAGKHKLLFRLKGKGKVGSGDLIRKVKVTR